MKWNMKLRKQYYYCMVGTHILRCTISLLFDFDHVRIIFDNLRTLSSILRSTWHPLWDNRSKSEFTELLKFVGR